MKFYIPYKTFKRVIHFHPLKFLYNFWCFNRVYSCIVIWHCVTSVFTYTFQSEATFMNTLTLCTPACFAVIRLYYYLSSTIKTLYSTYTISFIVTDRTQHPSAVISNQSAAFFTSGNTPLFCVFEIYISQLLTVKLSYS